MINSDGNWQHFFRLRRSDHNPAVRVGNTIAIDTAKTGSNHVRVIARGAKGQLWINGTYVSRPRLERSRNFLEMFRIFANYYTGEA